MLETAEMQHFNVKTLEKQLTLGHRCGDASYALIDASYALIRLGPPIVGKCAHRVSLQAEHLQTWECPGLGQGLKVLPSSQQVVGQRKVSHGLELFETRQAPQGILAQVHGLDQCQDREEQVKLGRSYALNPALRFNMSA